jgi:hypothetical protein
MKHEALIKRLETTCFGLDPVDPLRLLVDDVIAALAQPEQEPVAWIEKDMQCDDFDPDSVTCEKPTIVADGWEWVPLYTHLPQRTEPPQRTWVGLTGDEYAELAQEYGPFAINRVEAKLKEKNT